MVKISLQIKANLENIDKLETCHPEYPFFMKIKCTNCGESDEKFHDIMESEKTSSNIRSDGFNFYMKCKICYREITVDIVEKSNGSYTAEDSGKFKSIVTFDCRGAELVKFSPRTGWVVNSSANGQIFEDVDLSEDDWVEYDDKNNNSVGIYEFQSNFVKLKK